MKYYHILNALCSTPWMMQPEKMQAFAQFLMLRIESGKLSPEEVAERTDHPRKGESREAILHPITDASAFEAASGRMPEKKQANVGVLPIYGIIDHRAQMDLSGGGGFDIQSFRSQFRSMVDNPSVSAIVLDVDSPGGSVSGVEEMSREIYQARGKKPIWSVANTLAASAAYYIGSSASEFAVTPSGEVGSIGVYLLHQDLTEAYQQSGIKNTLIKAGKYKAEGNPWMELDEESMASLQKHVDAHYDMFTKAVARNRGVSVDAVRNGFGEGRTVMAKDAVSLGMADKVASLDEVLKSLGAKGSQKATLSGEAETPDIEAQEAAASEDVEVNRIKADAEARQREIDMTF